MITAVLDHLWQSTLVALGAALLTLPLRKAAAGVRYGLWFTASVKFLVPFAALAALGRLLAPALRSPSSAGPGAVFIAQAARPMERFPFAQPSSFSQLSSVQDLPPQAPSAPLHAPAAPLHIDPVLALLAVWALGCAAILAVWLVRWIRVRRIARSATPLPWSAPMPVLASASLMEPGLIGLWRPVLVVPESLPRHLAQAEIDAILAHEASHLRRRDNLTAAIHMLVEALFWFHPLVWWMGARLIEERERACDEAVVRAGHDRAAYARGLLESCRLYLQSPLPCVAGASGSKLKQRVETIMTAPLSSPLSPSRKALLLAAGVCAFGSPVAAGMLTSPAGRQAAARATAAASHFAPALAAGLAAPAGAGISAREGGGEIGPIVLAQTSAAAPGVSGPEPVAGRLGGQQPVANEDLRAPAAPPAPPSIPTAATAPPAPSPTVASVTVQGAAPPKMIEQQARSFVRGYASASNPEIDQIGRWHDAVCAEVVGLDDTVQAARIKARIEGAAQAVGLPAPRANCSANVEIVFTGQPQRMMDVVAKTREYLLGYYHLHDRDRLKKVTGPIQSWYVTDTSSNGGIRGGIVFVNHAPTRSMGVIDDPENMAPVGCGDASRFTACYRSGFDNVFIVADSKALEGKDAGLVADYMVMLALSKPRSLDGCNSLPSVIDVLAKSACPGREAPDGLTAADAAYLTALYKTDSEARRQFQQSEIAGRMTRILVSGSAGGR